MLKLAYFIVTVLNLTSCQIGTDTRGIQQEIEKTFFLRSTLILNKLLTNYDQRIRPNLIGSPVEVGVTIKINNIQSIVEKQMSFTMDINLRQYWIDRRLAFEHLEGFNDSEYIILNDEIIKKIWLPDTVFANARDVIQVKLPTIAQFAKLLPNGLVMYTTRLTVIAGCPMNFKYFPMDSQLCDLELRSNTYEYDIVRYYWLYGFRSSLVIEDDIKLPQFDHKFSLVGARIIDLPTGEYSRLLIRMYLRRHLGYYITQIYVPSALIVIISFVAFWIDRSSAPARATLGITSLLAMVTFITRANETLPIVSYVKGIDIYFIVSFIFTFATLIEYGFVLGFNMQSDKLTDKTTKHGINIHEKGFQRDQKISEKIIHYLKKLFIKEKNNADMTKKNDDLELQDFDIPPRPPRRKKKNKNAKKFKFGYLTTKTQTQTKKISKIDLVSRFLFPFLYTLFQIIYWIVYMKRYYSM